MFTCIICRFTHTLDDVTVPLAGADRCICLRCFTREAETARPMPKNLRRELIATLAAINVPA